MAASTRAVSSSGLSLPKWQIALAIGAPVALGKLRFILFRLLSSYYIQHMYGFILGLGIWYYRSKKNQHQKPINNEETQKKKATADVAAAVTVTNETGKGAEGRNGIDKTKEKDSEKSTTVVEEEIDPYKQAQTHKNKGNKFFKDGKYSDAIKCYQQAIDICPKTKVQDVSTFHQNRAAAFEQLVL